MKKPVMSLPMSPAVALDEPESGGKSACTESSAARRVVEAEAACCCCCEPFLEYPVAQRGGSGLGNAQYHN